MYHGIPQNHTRHFDDTPTTSAEPVRPPVSVVLVQPTSLIFVAVVVIWAAFLLQHWIRRREALVTARTVDQFSEAMRVLEHRGTVTPEPRDDAPLHTARTSAPLSRTSLRAGTVMTGEQPRPTSQPAPQTAERPVAPVEPERPAAPVRVGSNAIRILASLNSRRVRGIALLVSLALLLFAVVAAPFGMLAWWSPIVSLLLVAVVFTWLRREAVAEQRTQQPEQERAPRAGAPAPRQHAPQVSGPQLGSAQSAARVPLPPRETVFDHARPAEVPVSKPAPAAEHVEGGWSPVPVPPPTYTMKERADRPAPEPVSPAADETPVADLPFDGLALDEELEDLPAAWRVG